MAELFKDKMANLDFDGVSGPIRFSGPDRLGVSVFRQNQRNEMKTIAMYYPDDDFLHFNCSICVDISWIGTKERKKSSILRNSSFSAEVATEVPQFEKRSCVICAQSLRENISCGLTLYPYGDQSISLAAEYKDLDVHFCQSKTKVVSR